MRICRNYANVTAPLLIWMFIKNSNFFDSNTHSTDLPTPTKNSCHFCFPQLHLKLGKRGKEKYACRGELLSQQGIWFKNIVFFSPHSLSWSLSGYPDVEGMETRGGSSCSQTLFIWVSALNPPNTPIHTHPITDVSSHCFLRHNILSAINDLYVNTVR